MSIRLPACRNTVQVKVLNCTGTQSDSLKLDSVVLKTKSVSFRTHMPLKPDSIIPKTLLNRCRFLSGSPVRGALPFALTIVLSAQLCFQGNLSMSRMDGRRKWQECW